MGIYLCFIQHILWSLKENGKAAIVVPTGFLTAQTGIEKSIRQTIIEKRWLKGVISMPSNIFANTGTNVSVLFIDKANKDGEIMLVDASKLGEKVKDGKNQKTILRDSDVSLIETTFINQDVKEDFSVIVSYTEIENNKYSFSAGQYFQIKIEHTVLSEEEYDIKINEYSSELETLFRNGNTLAERIKKQMKELRYE